jgi:hypothetical protein
MPEPAKFVQIGETATENKPETGKNRLPGEPQLWFNRYCLYRDLGHKRSLRVAVAKERETLRVLKEPQPATKSTAKKVVGQKTAKKSPAAPVPEPVINVPGSWKNACKVYRWQERARSFDAWLINIMAEHTYEHLGDTYANKYKRLQLLDILIKSAAEKLNTALKNGMTHETYLDYIKQIAALAKQVEGEMSQLSEDEMKAAISAYGRAILDEMEKAYHSGETMVVRKA